MNSILPGIIGQLFSSVDNDFVIRVKTDNVGTSATNQFTLPVPGFGTYDYTIDWGDGTIETHTTDTPKTKTYPTAGIYTIKISGTFPNIRFNNGGDKLKLVETVNFGDVGWVNLQSAFTGCTNNVINVNCTGNFDLVTVADRAWLNNTNLGFFPAIDMPICINITRAWTNCNLTNFPLINLSSVISAGDFNGGAWQNNRFTSFPAINMPNCTDFRSTWRDCDLTSFPVVNLGTNKTNVDFRATWQNNNFVSFPALDLSKGTNFGGYNLGAWQGCGVITSFATRNFYAITNGQNCFQGTTLPTSDWSDILITQNANNSNNNVTFHGGSSTYNTTGGVARGELVSIQTWNITDGGAAIIEIGNQNSTSIAASITTAPWSYEYDYSFSAMIILQSELGSAKTIESIEFKVDNISSNFTANSQKIIMGHITETSFGGTTPTVDLANYTVSNKTTVKNTFSKSYTTADNDTWIKFDLTTSNFNYNGSDSLVIMWENKDTSYEFSGPNVYYDNSLGVNLTAYARLDGSYPTGNCSLTNERPIMKINYL